MVGRIIAFANQKGGVGKTTSCVNVAASLHQRNCDVLLVDLDPQGNATMGSGVNKNALESSVNDVLLEKKDIMDVIVQNTPAGYDLLPSNSLLTSAEVSLIKQTKKEQKLKQALEKVKEHYDFIVLDCPPSLNMLTLNALVAADSIIIPMQCEYYALEGLSALLQTMKSVQSINSKLKIEGIVRTMYDPRNKLSRDVSSQLKSHFGSKVYKTVIPRNVRLAEAPSHGLPVLLYDKSSRGAVTYLALAAEIMKACGKKSKKRARIKEDEYA